MSVSFTQAANTLTVIRGTSKTYELCVVDEANEPVDLTGATVYFTVKRCTSEETAVLQKTSANIAEIEIVTPKGGIARIYLTPTDTKSLDIREYVFDVWVRLASGKVYAVIPPSTLSVQAGVTVLT